ncbi:MAG: UDP-N-acetylmuramoyl-L-alanine--D-glutamate ligase [Myxococcota bacterium]|nr:UDP-N-acetylmuramoyl-L-alanine--D-glutamate ligase [Myxococcota bacterium]
MTEIGSLNLEGMEILVLGLGMSGRSAAHFCAERGARVIAADERSADVLFDAPESEIARELGPQVELVCGQPFPDPSRFDLVVPSPGIPPSRYAKAASRVWGDIELAGRALAIPVIAVTGTNGKSTTVRLIEAMLNAAGRRAEAAGNVGTPALSLPGKPLDIAVLEVSSFQLETIESFAPQVAVILNITPDHLDRHGDLAGYSAAKRRILENQGPGDVAVLDFDNALVRGFAEHARGEVIPFSRQSPPSLSNHPRAAWIDAGVATFADGHTLERVPLASGSGLSAHDRDNVLAALTAAWAAGVAPLSASQALSNFQALPHRCEVVPAPGPVRWINDSKATNPGAAQRAIEGCEAPVLWIAGGRGKGLSFAPLAEVAQGRVKIALLIGESTDTLAEVLEGRVPWESCGDLDAAVGRAASLADPGDIVLLAPACASFDQFKSFEHRGECFRTAVGRLTEESPA